MEDRERTLDSPTDKIMLSLTAFVDELEREKARQRTYDAMQRKSSAGHVTGGRVFGHDLLDVIDGRRVPRPPDRRHRHPDASHVERAINESEATVVRQTMDGSRSDWPSFRKCTSIAVDPDWRSGC